MNTRLPASAASRPPDRAASSAWPSRLEWGLILAFWALLALFAIGNRVLDPRDGMIDWARTPYLAGRVAIEFVIWAFLTPLIFRIAQAFPLERPRFGRTVLLHVGIALAIAVFVDVAEDLMRTYVFIEPGRTAEFTPLRSITRLWLLNEFMVYLVVLATGFAREHYLQRKAQQKETAHLEDRARTLEARTARLEAQLTEARLEALRMQLNPHFLFNTLHAISTLVERDPKGVRTMVARLSELLRRVLDEQTPQEVPLAQELEFLDDYLDIQKVRFQGKLDVTLDVPMDLRAAYVPNLILQPIVENAIKHGTSRVRGVGLIHVRARRKGDALALSVRDNGPGWPSNGNGEGVGLKNVKARLQELYGDDHTLDLAPAPEGGARVAITLPFHTGADLYVAEGAHATWPGAGASSLS